MVAVVAVVAVSRYARCRSLRRKLPSTLSLLYVVDDGMKQPPGRKSPNPTAKR